MPNSQRTLARFFIGGLIVSFFAVLAEMFRPKSFAGLFGAAPSIALATLGLTIASHGPKLRSHRSPLHDPRSHRLPLLRRRHKLAALALQTSRPHSPPSR